MTVLQSMLGVEVAAHIENKFNYKEFAGVAALGWLEYETVFMAGLRIRFSEFGRIRIRSEHQDQGLKYL